MTQYRILYNKTRDYYTVQSKCLGFWWTEKYSIHCDGPNMTFRFKSLMEARSWVATELKKEENRNKKDVWEIVE